MSDKPIRAALTSVKDLLRDQLQVLQSQLPQETPGHEPPGRLSPPPRSTASPSPRAPSDADDPSASAGAGQPGGGGGTAGIAWRRAGGLPLRDRGATSTCISKLANLLGANGRLLLSRAVGGRSKVGLPTFGEADEFFHLLLGDKEFCARTGAVPPTISSADDVHPYIAATLQSVMVASGQAATAADVPWLNAAFAASSFIAPRSGANTGHTWMRDDAVLSRLRIRFDELLARTPDGGVTGLTIVGCRQAVGPAPAALPAAAAALSDRERKLTHALYSRLHELATAPVDGRGAQPPLAMLAVAVRPGSVPQGFHPRMVALLGGLAGLGGLCGVDAAVDGVLAAAGSDCREARDWSSGYNAPLLALPPGFTVAEQDRLRAHLERVNQAWLGKDQNPVLAEKALAALAKAEAEAKERRASVLSEEALPAKRVRKTPDRYGAGTARFED